MKVGSLAGVSTATSVTNSMNANSSGTHSHEAVRNALMGNVPTICVECGRNPASMPLLCIPCAHAMCYFCFHTVVTENPDFEYVVKNLL